MELLLPKGINKIYWSLFPVILVLIGYNNIFNDWELQLYGFKELEDFGRLLYVIVESVFGSAFITALLSVFLVWIIKLLKRFSSNMDN